MTTKDYFKKFISILRPQRSFNMKKAAQSVMVASWLQIIVAVVLTIFYFTSYKTSTLYLVLLLIPIVVIGNAILMRNAWKILSSNEKTEQIIQTLETENQLIDKMRAQRHDFMNHLQVVYSLLQLDEHDDAQKYLKKVYSDLKEVGSLMRTSNQAVNALLAAKTQQGTQNGVRLQFEIKTQLNVLPMDDWTFCRVLGNLLDNAIYAAKSDINPLVVLRMKEDIHGLSLCIENNGDRIDENNEADVFKPGFTTKGDKGTGMGLYIVSGLLNDVGGSIELLNKERTTFKLFLPY